MPVLRGPSLAAHSSSSKELKFTITDGGGGGGGGGLGRPPAQGVSAETLGWTEKAHTQEAKGVGRARVQTRVLSLFCGFLAMGLVPSRFTPLN